MCASMVIDYTDILAPRIVSETADPTGKCIISFDGRLVTCENMECEGECELEGPTVLDPTKPYIQEWRCCCSGGAVAGSGCCGGGD